MVVPDCCYSGTLTRSASVGLRDANYLKRIARKRARVAMVSSGLGPAEDNGGGGNSPFARAFLNALSDNPDIIDGTRLFAAIRRPVILDGKQHRNIPTFAIPAMMAAISCSSGNSRTPPQTVRYRPGRGRTAHHFFP